MSGMKPKDVQVPPETSLHHYAPDSLSAGLATNEANQGHGVRANEAIMAELRALLEPYESPKIAPVPGGPAVGAVGAIWDVTIASARFQRVITEAGLLKKLWGIAEEVLQQWTLFFAGRRVTADVLKEVTAKATKASKRFEKAVAGREDADALILAFTQLKDAVIQCLQSAFAKAR